MRWLFLFVLSLNLAYIAWQMNLPAGASYSSVPPLKNVAPIVLLAELEQQKATLAVKSPADSGDNDVAVQKDVAVVSQHELSGEQAVLLQATNEDGGRAHKEAIPDEFAPDNAVPDKVIPVPVRKDSCFTLGPFRDADQVQALTTELKPFVISTDARQLEEKDLPLYWVNIKPAKNRKAAIATGKRLKKKKIKDFYIIRDGEDINGISLGYYRNKDGASGLVKKVKKLGFDVVLDTVVKTYFVYWLDYRLAPDAHLPESVIDKYIKADKKNTTTRLPLQCK